MSRRKALLNEAERVAAPPKRVEFRCPTCSGIADAFTENGMLITECHACSTMVRRVIADGKISGIGDGSCETT